jgi:hypothetical protein
MKQAIYFTMLSLFVLLVLFGLWTAFLFTSLLVRHRPIPFDLLALSIFALAVGFYGVHLGVKFHRRMP